MDHAHIDKLISYQPETGKLFWKRRPVSMFAGKEKRKKAHAKSWNSKYAGREIASKNENGYICVHIVTYKRFRLLGHRVAWVLHYGEWPDGILDHINGDPSDNRICNLRTCTPSQNARNTKLARNNTSGVTGVTFNKREQKWRAWINVERKCISLGYFVNKEDAVAARRAAEKIHGFYEARGHHK